MFQRFQRGSEWNKWDLHIHTPLSIVQHYGGDQDDVWEKFILDLESLPKEIKVIGINDYLFIDGYEKVLEYKNNRGRLKNLHLILPVFEFRLKKFVGNKETEKIHYHIIFADESILKPKKIREQFCPCLQVSVNLKPDEDSGEHTRIVTRDTLSEIGRKIREATPEEKRDRQSSDLEIGFKNVAFDIDPIMDHLNQKGSLFKNKFLTAIGKNEWENFRWDGSPAEKKTIVNSCDFVFVASESPEKALHARERLMLAQVKSNLLHCSDAHYYQMSKQETNKLGHCFTWIKADLTFEGLKQAVYEPEERVRIQQFKPEDDKPPSTVINRVEYKNYKNKDQTVSVLFNQNLNSLIGIRGSGKSNLLKNMTFISDREEYEKRGLKESELLKLPGCRVIWMDDKSSPAGENEMNGKKILFIPQKYLGSKVYEGEGGSTEVVNRFITELLNENIKFRDAREEMEKRKLEASKNTENWLLDVLHTRSNINSNIETLKKHPQQQDLESQINLKNNKIKEIKENTNLTEEDLNTHRTLLNEKMEVERNVARYQKDIDLYNQLRQNQIFDVTYTVSRFEFSEDEKANIDSHVKEHNELGEKFVVDRVKKIDEELGELKTKNNELSDKIKPTQEKINQNQEMEKLYASIKKDNEDLSFITSILIQNKQEKVKKENLIKKIKSNYEKTIQSLKHCLKDINIDLPDDLIIGFELRFDRRSFDVFLEKVNRKELPREYKELLEPPDQIPEEDVCNIINQLFDGLLSGEIILNKNIDIKECLFDLFSFRYSLDYLDNIKNQEGVILKNMSAGQKMLTLLSLIFSLDENRYPILIDQPEDDIDSTTISTTISDFIKKQKKDRQIIMASHNANLVICSDSEEVLVADNKQGEFTYKTGSIENPEINKRMVEVLEGGREAFRTRGKRYRLRYENEE